MRGKLRIYLGAAPGVGKTYAMLDEGWRRRERGTDVVIGLVVTHGRPKTIAQIRDLEVVDPRRAEYRGRTWDEIDVEAILARRPAVVLVDELAHTNVPGSAHEKRWQDIEDLLDAGIEVISTLNIQHLESINDVVNRITGVVQRETVPDAVVRRADQVEVVDMSPEALRRRMAHGNIYPPEKVDASLANFFRLGNLGALRELALLWVADRVEDSLQGYMAQHGITGPWETRERVLVALTGAPGGDLLIRRAARMARRAKGDLIGVHVVNDDGLTRPAPELLARHRTLLEEVGGTFHQVVGGDVPLALVGFATAQRATQIVLGTSRRSRWTELTRGSVINRVVRAAKGIDVHVIATDDVTKTRSAWRAPVRFAYAPQRMITALVLATAAIAVAGALVADGSVIAPHHPGSISAGAGLLLFLAIVAVVGAVGGRIPAMASAIVAVALVDFYLIPPYGAFAMAHGADAIYVAAFVLTALVVTVVVDQAARRRADALRSRDEADTVLALADGLAGLNPPQAMVEEIHGALGRPVTLLSSSGDRWSVAASAGEPAANDPAGGERFDLQGGEVLVISGPPLDASEHRLVAGLAAYLEAIITMNRLHGQATAAESLTHANELRNALLAAVSHDLRTPLASIKALTSGWLEPDVDWSRSETSEFMASIDAETDRLTTLVENLLDMSRLQSGAVHLVTRPVSLDEVVSVALAGLGPGERGVVVDVPETLPLVDLDPALFERALANIVDNALRHSAADSAVLVEAAVVAGRVDVRIVDRGRGIPLAQRETVFQAFQRLGDTAADSGVGLGLAVAKGFVEALGGTIVVEDTPGGGTTMVISLPAAVVSPSKETELVR